ncbi:MAG: hypothetical protein EAZ99_15730 [Alphaproteobacteria bacterium]|nr:hypothetical protein [Alphaproteobacteria bacterium]TAD87936.1 MAG: hypothetical protein EAZ99_15730 [Alphaproteobacteria bacterium]
MSTAMRIGGGARADRLSRRAALIGVTALAVGGAASAAAQTPKGPQMVPLGPMRFQVKDYWHGMQQLTVLYAVEVDEANATLMRRHRPAIQDRLNTAVTARLAQDFGGARGHELLKEILRDEVLAPLSIYPSDILLTNVTLARRS